MAQDGIEIFYDGQCPFCTSYVRLLDLRSQVGRVELIDARSEDPRLAHIRAAGLDLDEGMAVRHGAQLYHGSEAAWILAVWSEPGGGFRRFLAWLMRNPKRARLVYPFMACGRKLVLRLMRRPRLGREGL